MNDGARLGDEMRVLLLALIAPVDCAGPLAGATLLATAAPPAPPAPLGPLGPPTPSSTNEN